MKRKPSTELADSLDLDAWADALVTTAPDAVAEMRTVAKRLSNDTRLATKDREFAKSQLAAIQRAVRRHRKSVRNNTTNY